MRAVIMGRQGNEKITVHDMAKLKNSVSNEVLTSWRLRLKRTMRERRKHGSGKRRSPMEAEPVDSCEWVPTSGSRRI